MVPIHLELAASHSTHYIGDLCEIFFLVQCNVNGWPKTHSICDTRTNAEHSVRSHKHLEMAFLYRFLNSFPFCCSAMLITRREYFKLNVWVLCGKQANATYLKWCNHCKSSQIDKSFLCCRFSFHRKFIFILRIVVLLYICRLLRPSML